MCCLLAALALVGPRVTILVWWPLQMERWESAFDSFWVAFLGFIFLPWTTLVFVAVAPAGSVRGFDWFFLGLAVMADVASYSGGAYGSKDR